MKRPQILVLLAIVIALGLWIAKVEGPRMLREALGDRLVALEVESVDGLTLSYADGRRIEMRREPRGDWLIDSPTSFQADKGQVERLLSAVAELEVERRLKPDETSALSEYGLADNGSTVRLDFSSSDGELPSIIVGRTTPVGFSVFTRLADSEEVALVPLIFNSVVQKTLFDFQDKSLLNIEPANVIRIAISKPDGQSVVVSRADEQWTVVEPSIDDAHTPRVRGLLGQLSRAAVIAFPDPKAIDPSQLGFETPSIEIRLDFADGESETLSIGGAKEGEPPGRFAKRESDGTLAVIDTDTFATLDVPPAGLYDQRLFRCDEGKVHRIYVARAARETFGIKKQDEGWVLEPENGDAVDQAVANRFLTGLLKLEGTAIASMTAGDSAKGQAIFGLDDPSAELEVIQKDGQRCASVITSALLSEDEQSVQYFFQRRGSSIVYAAEPHEYSHLDYFRDDFILPPPPVDEDLEEPASDEAEAESEQGASDAPAESNEGASP